MWSTKKGNMSFWYLLFFQIISKMYMYKSRTKQNVNLHKNGLHINSRMMQIYVHILCVWCTIDVTLIIFWLKQATFQSTTCDLGQVNNTSCCSLLHVNLTTVMFFFSLLIKQLWLSSHSNEHGFLNHFNHFISFHKLADAINRSLNPFLTWFVAPKVPLFISPILI